MHYDRNDQRVIIGDSLSVLKEMKDNSVHCCVTSPPYYGLRDYKNANQIGLEKTPEEYVNKLVEVFSEVKRVLRDDGTLWLNLGDSYAAQSSGTHQPAETISGGIGGLTQDGHLVNRDRFLGYNPTRNASAIGLKHKDLIGIPWRVAFALQSNGWYLRSDIIWSKINPMPESVSDRPSKSHEYLFLFSKSEKYYYDSFAVCEKSKTDGLTRNKRTVWDIPVARFKGSHFAVFPEKLIEPCILSGTSEKGCCPHCGSPWNRVVSKQRIPTRPGHKTKTTGEKMTDGNRDKMRHVTKVESIGWVKSCQCQDNNPVPCTVLDPFCGSGTTLVVAKKNKRDGIGVEINEEYAKVSEGRIGSIQKTLFDI
jgi:DNA modification methylase